MVSAVDQEALSLAIEDAHSVCSLEGHTSPACAARWDIVEELQAALAHHRVQHPQVSSLDRFCEAHPEAQECRMYDV
ncbi:Calvin cycle protein CP12 [Lyngbya confervoides]|uniref:Calvin cycle protein CP12 n=1 Tax=Lyngbya confervoides BDU141951 TaxID=1574623 RepID=A0ABD4SYF5_9CYAN|nr:Calvin cycle protein CP12 [Lyngbya confervoides]MCM1981481.1 Calvin cycle protein CP12 [Lyngbya confervoides BDU141951]